VYFSPPPIYHGLIVHKTPALAAPDPVDHKGVTPLYLSCHFGNAKMAIALLHGGANLDFTSLATTSDYPGFTPLMYAVDANNAGVAKLLLKRGADGAKTTTRDTLGYAAGSTALDIARKRANNNRRQCGDAGGAPPEVLQHVRHDVPRPVRADGGRGAAPQAVRRLPRPRLPRAVLLEGVPARGLGAAASRCLSAPRRGGRGMLPAPRYEPGTR
jgi:hypothetical protein